jgi:5-hydroxyisourate hydrolase
MNRQHARRAGNNAGLRIHVLDTTRGTVAEGLRVEVFLLGKRAEKRCSGRVGPDGSLEDPALCRSRLVAGEYEVVFHVGEYFRGRKGNAPSAPLLEGVTLRLGIFEPDRAPDLPLRISPSGICMAGV